METKELFKEVQALRHKISLKVAEQDSLEDNANIALVSAMVKWEGDTMHIITLLAKYSLGGVEMSRFNAGDRVKVYNEDGLEGVATLKGECQISDPIDGEYWNCVFDGDEYQDVSRWVKPEHTVSRLYKKEA